MYIRAITKKKAARLPLRKFNYGVEHLAARRRLFTNWKLDASEFEIPAIFTMLMS
jgi:hypothetical protein